MRKLTALILVFSLVFCLCACGHKDDTPDERDCGVYITVEADDIYTVSCGTESGSESATPAEEDEKISAGETFHFDFAGEAAEGSESAVIPYMICVYDKDFNVISEASFEDDFANMAKIDIVVTKEHDIIYKGGNVDCGGNVVVSMCSYDVASGVTVTDAAVVVNNGSSAGSSIDSALASYTESFKTDAEANRASYTSNVSSMSGEIPPFKAVHDISVARGNGNVVSFRIRDYAYLGTSELETISGHSFDLNTGNELKLADVFSDVDGIKKQCTEYILISTTTDDGVYNEGFTDAIPELINDGNWYLSNEGLVIVANKGVISDTLHEFTVPYSDIEQYINEAYLPAESDKMTSGNIIPSFADENSASELNFVGYCAEQCAAGDLIISAGGCINDVAVYTVSYNEESNSYGLINQLFYCSDLYDGGAFSVKTALESTPNILVQFSTPYGNVVNNFLSVDESGNISITDPDGGNDGIDILPALPFTIDLNGDGTDDVISIKGGVIDIQSDEVGAEFDTGLEEITSALLHDSDCDGYFELFVSGDLASDDYIIYCLKFDGRSIKAVSFDGDHFIFGDIKGFTANVINVNTVADILGTYSYTKQYEYKDGEFKAVEKDSYKINSEQYIVPNADLTTSEGGTIPAGTELRITGTDFASFVTVETKDGESGTLSLSTTDGDNGWLINDTPESEVFQSLPYAG